MIQHANVKCNIFSVTIVFFCRTKQYIAVTQNHCLLPHPNSTSKVNNIFHLNVSTEEEVEQLWAQQSVIVSWASFPVGCIMMHLFDVFGHICKFV